MGYQALKCYLCKFKLLLDTILITFRYFKITSRYYGVFFVNSDGTTILAYQNVLQRKLKVKSYNAIVIVNHTLQV